MPTITEFLTKLSSEQVFQILILLLIIFFILSSILIIKGYVFKASVEFKKR
jgi:hypothetical protein